MADVLPENIRILTNAINKNTDAYIKSQQQLEHRVGRGSRQRELEAEIKSRKRAIELIEAERDLQAQANVEQRRLNAVTATTQRELRRARAALGQLGQTTTLNTDILVKEVRQHEDNLDTLEKARNVREKMIGTLKSTIKSLTDFSVASNLLTYSFKTLYSEVQNSYAYQTRIFSDWQGELKNVRTQLHLTGAEAQQLDIANRRVINASGGVYEVFKNLAETKDAFFELTGSYPAAAQAVMSLNAAFRQAGVDLEGAQIARTSLDMTGDLQDLSRMTGKTTEEIIGMYSGLIQSEGMQQELLKVDEARRKAIIKDTLATIKHYTAAGKSIDATIQMVEAMKAFQAMSPRERLKEAAKARAIMGAMGVQGGGRMMELMMKPPGSLSPADQEEMAGYSGALSAKMQRQMGAGGARMFAAGAMMEQLGPGMQKIMQETNMTLAKASEQDLKQREKFQGEGGIMTTAIKSVFESVEAIRPLLLDPLYTAIGGAAVGATSFVNNLAMMKLLFPSITDKLKTVLKYMGKPFSIAFAGLKTGFVWLGKTMMSFVTRAIPMMGHAILGLARSAIAALVPLAPFLPIILAISAAIFAAMQAWEALTTGDSGIARFLRETFPKAWDWIVDHIGGSIAWIVDKWQGLKIAIGDLVDSIIGWFKNLPGNIAAYLRGLGGPAGYVARAFLGDETPTTAPVATPTGTVREPVAQALAPAYREQQENARLLREQLETQRRQDKDVARETTDWQKQIAEQLGLANKTSVEMLEWSMKSDEEKKELTRRGQRESRLSGTVSPYRTGP